MSFPRIYIPSHKRTSTVFAVGNTVHSLKAVQDRITIVVYEDELYDYMEALPTDLGQVEFAVCPVRGIANKRAWIGQLAASLGEDKFILADDDLCIYVRKSPTAWNLRYTEDGDIEPMIAILADTLDSYGAVGVTPREGFNHTGDFALPEDTVENTRIMRFAGFRTKEFNECQHGRIQFMEDFDVLLQQLSKGIPNANLIHYAQGQRGTQTEGGCAEYRDNENHSQAAEDLHHFHPNFVKLRQKENKTGGEFGKRTEVTIYWKKAYNYGLEQLL